MLEGGELFLECAKLDLIVADHPDVDLALFGRVRSGPFFALLRKTRRVDVGKLVTP